jgi:hypothetical protein
LVLFSAPSRPRPSLRLCTPCRAFPPAPAALPRPQLTLLPWGAPRHRARLARCHPALRSAHASVPSSDVPAHLEGAAVTKPESPAPRSDASRMTRLRTPRREPGRGGRQHQQPATLPMPSQLAPLTTPSSLRVLYPRRRVARRLAPRCVKSHKRRLAPALGLEIPWLSPTDSPSSFLRGWSTRGSSLYNSGSPVQSSGSAPGRSLS